MEKEDKKYRLILEDNEKDNEPLVLDFNCMDDLFHVISHMQQKNPFDDTEEAARLAIGIKLFGEVMMHHSSHPLFKELRPAFTGFMRKIKSL